MGNSEWGVPTPNGNSWVPQDPGTQNRNPRSGPGMGVFIAIALVAVVALIIAGVVVWNQFGSDDSDNSDNAGGPDFAPVTETTGESPSPESPSGSAESSASAESAETSEATEPDPDRPDNDDSEDDDDSDSGSDNDPGSGDLKGDQITDQGFRGVSEAQCNGSDEWVFAGTNGTDRAVICQVGGDGDYYYRGYYDEGGAEHDIDMARLGNDYWVTQEVGSLRIEISSDGVRVVHGDGSERSHRDFTWSSEK